MGSKVQDLHDAGLKAVEEAKAIATAAEGRDMTDDERAQFKAHMDRGQELYSQLKTAREDAEALKAIESQFGGMTLEGVAAVEAAKGWGGDNRPQPRKSLERTVLDSPEFKRFMQPFTKSDGTVHIPERAPLNSDPVQVKALVTGASDTLGGAFITNDRTDIYVPVGRRELTVRDLISVRRTSVDVVEFVRETSHTNSAAVVAEATSAAAPTTGASSGAALTLNAGGGYKPEGAFAYEVVTAAVKTIAEWVPATKRALADASQLEGLIRDGLIADVVEKEEDQVLNGSGTGENITGILATSGIQTQAATTTNDKTRLTSYRQAITKIRTTGRSIPNGVVVNPVQAEAIDTSADSSLRFYGNGPFSTGPRTLWGLPMVESEAIAAGTALVGDFSKAVLWDREQATISMTNSHADFFIRNLVAILAEERVAFGVTRPSAFCTVTGL
jgi:HK97 family phage major capsid protein